MAGICNYMITQNEWMAAVMVFVMFTAYLRPGELMKIQKQDIVQPTGGVNAGLQLLGIIVAPQERPREPSKTRE